MVMANTRKQTFKIDNIKIPYAGVSAYKILFESATVPEAETRPEDWRARHWATSPETRPVER